RSFPRDCSSPSQALLVHRLASRRAPPSLRGRRSARTTTFTDSPRGALRRASAAAARLARLRSQTRPPPRSPEPPPPPPASGADAPKNVDRAVAYIRQAAREGARLVALPETYPGPYTVPVDYSPHEALAAAARAEKVYVVGGAIEYVRPDDTGHAPCFNCLYL